MPRLSWLVLFHAVRLGSSSRLLFHVPTRCAARLLFMNACKATSAEANGMGAPPCSSVNNAFGTNLQFFKDTGGLLSSGAQCCLRAMQILAHVPKWCPSEPLAPTLLSLRGANEGQYNSSKFFFSFFGLTLIMMQSRVQHSSSSSSEEDSLFKLYHNCLEWFVFLESSAAPQSVHEQGNLAESCFVLPWLELWREIRQWKKKNQMISCNAEIRR